MKAGFLILVFLHGIIHLMGFVKGYGIRDVKELTLPISKTMGVLWLVAAILLFLFAVFYLLHSKYAWILGVTGFAISQFLVVAFWKDAKFGTIPNVILLAISLMAYGQFAFQKLVKQETDKLLELQQENQQRILSERDIENLPEPVKNWLRKSGAIGHPYLCVGKVIQKAEMKMKPEQTEWMTATAIQYTSIVDPGFVWTVDIKMNRFLFALGRDKFENGKGEMLVEMNALFKVVDEKGEKMDEGTLQRFLGEMVWFPTLAVSPYVTWKQLDETTAEATMNYKGTSGSGVFHFDAQGNVTSFNAMRFKENVSGAKRYPWIMNITSYKEFEGIKVPVEMSSTWKLDDADWTWLKLTVTEIAYNQRVK